MNKRGKGKTFNIIVRKYSMLSQMSYQKIRGLHCKKHTLGAISEYKKKTIKTNQ